MRRTHLTEQELQDYARKLPVDLELVRHVTRCQHCQAQINAYGQVYQFLTHSESPALNFDPVDLLPAGFGKPRLVEKERSWFLPLIVMGIVLSMIAGFILLWPYIHFIFTGNTSFALVTGSAVGLLVMIAGLFELVNSYHRNLDLIDREPADFNINI